MTFRWSRLLVGVTLLALAGCRSQCTVTGTVTWNGDPVAQGDITFIDPDGKVTPATARIVDGKYQMHVLPGRKRVEILASREGEFDRTMNQARREQYIPDRYNANSTLTAEVESGGANRFDFPLTDKQ